MKVTNGQRPSTLNSINELLKINPNNAIMDADDPFRAFVEQADDLTSQAFEDGTVSIDILANVASSLWTFPSTTITTASGSPAYLRLKAPSATVTTPKQAPNTCDDCGASLLHVNSLSRLRIERPRATTAVSTRTQRRRAARRRKATQNNLLCCKTIQIHTCYRCDAKIQTPAVRNPRPQRKNRGLLSSTIVRRNLSKPQQQHPHPQHQATIPKLGIPFNSVKSVLSDRSSQKQQLLSPSPPQSLAMRMTLDDHPKKKKRKKDPPKNSLMEFLSSLND